MEPPNGNLLMSLLTRQQIELHTNNARRTDTISSHFYNSRDYSVLDAEPLSADILSSAAQREIKCLQIWGLRNKGVKRSLLKQYRCLLSWVQSSYCNLIDYQAVRLWYDSRIWSTPWIQFIYSSWKSQINFLSTKSLFALRILSRVCKRDTWLMTYLA